MHLSEFKGEKCFEALDRIMPAIYEIFSDKGFTAILNGMNNMQVFSYVFKTHRSSVIEIMATLQDKTAEEFMQTVSLADIPIIFSELLSDIELQRVFRLQRQKGDATSSASV